MPGLDIQGLDKLSATFLVLQRTLIHSASFKSFRGQGYLDRSSTSGQQNKILIGKHEMDI